MSRLKKKKKIKVLCNLGSATDHGGSVAQEPAAGTQADPSFRFGAVASSYKLEF